LADISTIPIRLAIPRACQPIRHDARRISDVDIGDGFLS
jgi:hypothetical protein